METQALVNYSRKTNKRRMGKLTKKLELSTPAIVPVQEFCLELSFLCPLENQNCDEPKI